MFWIIVAVAVVVVAALVWWTSGRARPDLSGGRSRGDLGAMEGQELRRPPGDMGMNPPLPPQGR